MVLKPANNRKVRNLKWGLQCCLWRSSSFCRLKWATNGHFADNVGRSSIFGIVEFSRRMVKLRVLKPKRRLATNTAMANDIAEEPTIDIVTYLIHMAYFRLGLAGVAVVSEIAAANRCASAGSNKGTETETQEKFEEYLSNDSQCMWTSGCRLAVRQTFIRHMKTRRSGYTANVGGPDNSSDCTVT
uniref:Uncharacterized protein n=1 Tax=Romanomermis culicivorax TaxID=13658 RepID=A0A915JCB7_ROMCU